ncbi:MAG: carotenoid biosynthesis protein, partial [Phormidium sp.]
MKQLVIAERFCLAGHILSMVFGWAGLLYVLPRPELIASLPDAGQAFFGLSMAWGGVINIILGAIAVSIFAYRTWGIWPWLSFMFPAMMISVSSELLGTSTGFPFGDYHYLNGLGYKIADLVPFTIPISWFYMGIVCYAIARAGIRLAEKPSFLRQLGAIALGALMFTSWDFALEPAMSQTIVPFWYWEQAGAFFGTPYQNYVGWYGTSFFFMSVAAILWNLKIGAGKQNLTSNFTQNQLLFPLAIYVSNFG